MGKNKQAEFVKWIGAIIEALKQLGGSGKPKEVSEKIAEMYKIPDKILEETLSSGQSRFYNQVAWARQYLVWEGLLDSSKYGTWSLTEKGSKVKLSTEESRKIFLKWVQIHAETRKNKNKSPDEILNEELESEPEETTYKPDLLEVLQSLTPNGFERICQTLLRESGFEKVTITGKSHDGGIDGTGILEVNPFVSFKVLFQCKRYKGSVSRAQVGDFRNAMIGRADKGIIITTGTFTNEAVKEANRDGAPQVELVNGVKLVEMFKKVELGVKPKVVYEVDLPFFEPYLEKQK